MRRWEHWIDWQSGAHTHDFRDLSAMRRSPHCSAVDTPSRG
ncbi:hypothetical protein [Mycobacteroides salmoniphilum]|nr:hypothetical protein [Mycobacteroides salmoniphilum]